MARPDIKHIALPRGIAPRFGKRTPGHRYYELYGGIEDYRAWLHDLAEHVGLVLSTGEAATYLGIARVSVWRWVNEGKLSSFNFVLSEEITSRTLRIRSLDACIPLSELRQWHELRLARKEDAERMKQEAEERRREGEAMENAYIPSDTCHLDRKIMKRDKKLQELEKRIKREQIAVEEDISPKKKTN